MSLMSLSIPLFSVVWFSPNLIIWSFSFFIFCSWAKVSWRLMSSMRRVYCWRTERYLSVRNCNFSSMFLILTSVNYLPSRRNFIALTTQAGILYHFSGLMVSASSYSSWILCISLTSFAVSNLLVFTRVSKTSITVTFSVLRWYLKGLSRSWQPRGVH